MISFNLFTKDWDYTQGRKSNVLVYFEVVEKPTYYLFYLVKKNDELLELFPLIQYTMRSNGKIFSKEKGLNIKRARKYIHARFRELFNRAKKMMPEEKYDLFRSIHKMNYENPNQKRKNILPFVYVRPENR